MQQRIDILREIDLRKLFSSLFPGIAPADAGPESSSELAPDPIRGQALVPCPFHPDQNPSLNPHYEAPDGKPRFHCFGCGAGGDAVDLVQAAARLGGEELSFPEALGRLSELTGIEVGGPHAVGRGPTFSEAYQARRLQRERLQTVADYFKECLKIHPAGSRVRSWLIERGVPQETWERLPIGIYPPWEEIKAWAMEQEIPRDWLKDERLLVGAAQGGGKWTGALAFFYGLSFNEISRIKLRIPRTREIIFLGKKGQEIGFFGLSSYDPRKGGERVLLVEGEFDLLVPWALAIQERGLIPPIFCRSGGAAKGDRTFKLLAGLGVQTPYLFPDNDESGLQWTEKSIKGAEAADLSVLVSWPEDYRPGEDPAELCLRLASFEAFQEAIAQALLPWRWVARRIIAEADGSPEVIQGARRKVRAYARKLEGTARSDFLAEVAETLHAPIQGLFEDLRGDPGSSPGQAQGGADEELVQARQILSKILSNEHIKAALESPEALKAIALVARLDRGTYESALMRLRDCGVRERELEAMKRTVNAELKNQKRNRKTAPDLIRGTHATHPGNENQVIDSCPYMAQEGRIFYLAQRTGLDGEVMVQPCIVADFEARIAEEATAEDGTRWYTISGVTALDRPFRLEISAKDFAEDRLLLPAISQAAGAQSPVRAGQVKHLRPAIQLLTDSELRSVRRYDRTGWADGRFLIPGREPDEVTIHLPRKLPYRIPAEADLEQGLEAFEALLESMPLRCTTVVAAAIFTAPLALPADWRGERYCMIVVGPTGAMKTSWTQCGLCLYGPDFIRDDLLIKWGEGATRNAIMALATHTHDLPMLIDNYKPGTGGGTKDFINLIHNIVEGGEKDRLGKDAGLRDTRSVFCWPLATGEDVPDRDPASLARALVVSFEWPRGEANPRLSQAQALSSHLAAVGRVWLEWLESDQGSEIIRQIADLFEQKRSEWAAKLRQTRSDASNILRVASSLATNQLTWLILRRHPVLGPIAERYAEEHARGLEEVAGLMATYTAEAREATRFLGFLKDLLIGRCILLDKGEEPKDSEERDRHLGWRDRDGSAYIVPSLAMAAIERVWGKDALGGISSKALYAQLNGLGVLASKDRGEHTRTLKIGGHDGYTRKTLHLKSAVLREEGEEGEEGVIDVE